MTILDNEDIKKRAEYIVQHIYHIEEQKKKNREEFLMLLLEDDVVKNNRELQEKYMELYDKYTGI